MGTTLPALRLVRAAAAACGVVLLGVAVPAARAGDPASDFLRITGSSTMCPMIEAIGARFAALRPGFRIEVRCGGSDRAIKDLAERSADIGMVARALKSEEGGLFGFPIARDGASIIVHRSNPLESLSEEQVAAVFSGATGSWRPLTGKDAPIAVILRERDKPITELFEKHFKLAGRIRGRVVAGDNPVTIAVVASDPDAIGYVSAGSAEHSAKAGAAIRLVPIDGVIPSERNIITGNYPLTRPLSLVTRELPAGAVKEFVDYCLSAKVVDLIERFDFVPYED